MPIHLNITADTVEDFDKLYARFAPVRSAGKVAALAAPYGSGAIAADSSGTLQNAEEPETDVGIASMTAKQIKALANSAEPEQIEALLAEEQAGKNRATVVKALQDALAEDEPEEGNAADTSTSTESTGEAASTQSEDAATPDAAPTSSDGQVITEDMLKTAMMDALSAAGANAALQALQEATGCTSLTSGASSVVSKAKDDPGVMKRAYDALIAAAA